MYHSSESDNEILRAYGQGGVVGRSMAGGYWRKKLRLSVGVGGGAGIIALLVWKGLLSSHPLPEPIWRGLLGPSLLGRLVDGVVGFAGDLERLRAFLKRSVL